MTFSMNNIIFFIIVLIVSFVLTYLVRYWAICNSFFDIPNERSSHSIPTPRIGGIAIAIAWYLGLYYLRYCNKIDNSLFISSLMGIPLAIVGLLDDLIKLKPALRLLIQALCGGFALIFIGGLESVSLFSIHYSNPYILNIIALIGIIWSINLFNFLDGIDGYIGTELIYIGIAIFILSGEQIGLLMAFVTMGFLFWNWQPAKIFMGDAGSTLMGFNISLLTIYFNNSNLIHIPVLLILTSVFWVDATITLLRRIKNGEQLSKAHRKHAYQRIVQSGFSHSKTVLFALVINIILFFPAWLSFKYELYDWIYLICSVIILLLVNKQIDRRQPFID
jgi:UDP-N-acetylmuramyl pentapeptide phosphotransferase/UDP-N-acetylglucosamine-1-phosphate transferase